MSARNKCYHCGKNVYAMEMISFENYTMHTSCCRCSVCHNKLHPFSIKTVSDKGKFVLYCTHHYPRVQLGIAGKGIKSTKAVLKRDLSVGRGKLVYAPETPIQDKVEPSPVTNIPTHPPSEEPKKQSEVSETAAEVSEATLMEDLRKENERLKQELEALKHVGGKPVKRAHEQVVKDLKDLKDHVSIVIVGASGDLAKKKTFPSLFALYGLGLLPPNFTIFGFSRSKMSDEDFRKKHVVPNFKGWENKREEFAQKCFYHSGDYGSKAAFDELDALMKKYEKNGPGNRLFYMAIPPSIFIEVAKSIRASSMSQTGWNRVVIEKPFGKDSESSAALSRQLEQIFEEHQMYRIDHYLGKEMVQNLMTLRFANSVFDPLWNRNHISSVQITFKEDIGTEGRGGYFDEFGIIRDVMQNHLLQILALVAMEAPVSGDAEDIRDEKVKVLRACEPIKIEDVVIGQYGKDAEGKKQSYLEDPTVPKGSLVPTFATAVLHINNGRWKGIPFFLKCGKALNERKADIRVQFYENSSSLYPNTARNELVIRVQPNEAVYLKFNAKAPGMSENVTETELDLTYNERFDARLPDAYERLIYDVLRGDHNLFVRADELEAAWAIFTPILHQIEKEKIPPVIYPFGSRGPQESDELIQSYGVSRSENYKWDKQKKQ